MRYVGQSYEVETPIPSGVLVTGDLAAIANAFHKVHESEFGVSSDDFEPAFVSLSVAAIGKLDALPEIKPILLGNAEAQTGVRDVFIDGEWVTCTVYNGEALAIGADIDGPAILDYEHACAVLPTWSTAQVNHQGALVITLDI
jgi:N-methylhydantoinase A